MEAFGSKDFFSIRHIITTSYDESIDKCSCEATVVYGNSSPETEVEYTFVIDHEGYLHTEYKAPSNILFEKKSNGYNEDFIWNLLDEIKTARKDGTTSN